MKTTHAPGGPKARLRRLGAFAGTKIAAGLIVIVVVPTVLVTLAAQERKFSPFDEFAHVDYLRRIEHLEIPRQGDLRGDKTLREEKCRGVPVVERSPCPPANASRRVLLGGAVTARGFSYEAQQPPLYYAVTAVLHLATEPLTSDDLESARLTGIVWLTVGLLLLFGAIRRLGGGFYSSLLGCAVVVCSPAVIWQASTVNNDAATVLVAALALLVLGHLRKAQGILPWVVGAVVASACVWLKPTYFVVFAVVAAVLVWWRWRTDSPGGLALRLGVLLVPPVLAYVAWSAIFDARAIAPGVEIADALLGSHRTNAFPWSEALPSIARMLHVYDIAPLPGYSVGIDSPAVIALASVFGVVLLAGGLAWLFHTGPATVGQQIGIVTVGVLLLLGPAYLWFLYLHYGQAGSAHQRYALVLVPLLAACLALTVGNRGRIVLAVLVPATLAAEIFALA